VSINRWNAGTPAIQHAHEPSPGSRVARPEKEYWYHTRWSSSAPFALHLQRAQHPSPSPSQQKKRSVKRATHAFDLADLGVAAFFGVARLAGAFLLIEAAFFFVAVT